MLPHLLVADQIISLTESKLFAISNNIYKETLRELKNIFGSIYYLDGNNNKILVKCSVGSQDRTSGKQAQDNTMVLPYITIVETGSANDDDRRRYSQTIVSEKVWDSNERRAKRYLSLPPRPVNITYDINIWTKFISDIDQIRYSIFSKFNPELKINTKYSNFTKAYIKSETPLSDIKAQDNSDRLIQKSISIEVQTYLPSPKFLYTNTGEIKDVNIDFEIVS
jgi:hypothetical protein